MSVPKISVVTVCYNAAQHLEATMQSVLNQSYPHIEYIIVDGGSTDGTLDVIKKYDGKLAKWISEPDRGIYDAMNKGLEITTGDWVYFVNSGDILFDVIAQIVPAFKDDHCIYYGDVYSGDVKRLYDGKFSAYKLSASNICHQAIFYPASVFKKYRYELKYKASADHYLNILCFADKSFRFKYMPVIITNYEGNGFSATNPDVEFIKDRMGIIWKKFPLIVYLYAVLRG